MELIDQRPLTIIFVKYLWSIAYSLPVEMISELREYYPNTPNSLFLTQYLLSLLQAVLKSPALNL